MGAAKVKKANGKYPAQMEVTPISKPASTAFTKPDDDETMGLYEFRKITEREKSSVVFNDGNLAFTIEFTSQEDRDKGNGILYSAATFRTMTDLSKEEFLSEYPVVESEFWHKRINAGEKNEKHALEVFETMLREDWQRKLVGDIVFNDGDRVVQHMLLNDGEEGLDYILRSETALTKAQFKKQYPVTRPAPWTAKDFDSFLAKITEQGLIHLPTYTRERVLALFKLNDSRIQDNFFGTGKSIVLSDVPGYFTYSDERGGIARFFRGDNDEEVCSFTREITDDLRKNPEHDDPDCDCKWTDATYGCKCDQHHTGVFHHVIPVIETCNTTECDGKHAHLYGFCQVCFNADIAAGVKPADASANAIHVLLR